MGLNGLGKSILVQVFVGCEEYEVSEGSVQFCGEDLFEFDLEECVQVGFFLVFQYLVEIFGISNIYFFKVVVNLVCKVYGKEEFDVVEFFKLVCEKVKVVEFDDLFFKCLVNEGFFGGEKKCNEIFQMVVFELKMVIFDEIDFGFDIDVFKVVLNGVNSLCDGECSFFVIIYYQCLFEYIVFDYVYVFVDGCIVCFGGKELVFEFEECGYGWFE